MTRDFAKKTKMRNSASRFGKQKESNAIPAWTWVIAGLLIGTIATVMIVLSLNSVDTTTKEVTKKKEIPSAKSRYQAVPAEASDTDLDFHYLLENKVVELPDQTKQNSSSKQKLSTKRYIMQCGSFRKIGSAESLKASIALNGFTAHIKATDAKSGKRWFRVVLGPYTTKRMAESERHQLERNSINNCRIW